MKTIELEELINQEKPLLGTLNFYDEWDLKIAVDSKSFVLAINDLDEEMRRIVKHDYKKSDDFIEGVGYVRERLWNILQGYGINLEVM